MSDELSLVIDEVKDRVTPAAEERKRLETVVQELRTRARSAITDHDVDADIRHVGSTARDTWLSGDRDIDIFVRFPPSFERAELERIGLEIGYSVLPDGHEEYAEHPYVTGIIDGFDVDLVPCYAVESPDAIESAVDRTPFHDDYLSERLTETLTGEIRVLKQFLSAIDVYGSNLRTRGFSGYLTELLILEFESVRTVLQSAADWVPPVRLDPAGHGTGSFDDPLVVIDPTDPSRNVAAVCSADNLARLQHHAREVIASPTGEAFASTESAPIDATTLQETLDRRGTTPVAIRIDRPELVEDDLYPQLRRSLGGIADALERRGFDLIRQAVFVAEGAVLLFELEVPRRPPIERHEGPPVHVREHADAFLETWANSEVFGPFIEDGRYVIERDRSIADAITYLRSDAILEPRHGAAIQDALADNRTVYVGDELRELIDEFGIGLADYFDPEL